MGPHGAFARIGPSFLARLSPNWGVLVRAFPPMNLSSRAVVRTAWRFSLERVRLVRRIAPGGLPREWKI